MVRHVSFVGRAAIVTAPLWLFFLQRWVGELGGLPLARMLYMSFSRWVAFDWQHLYETCVLTLRTMGPLLGVVVLGALHRSEIMPATSLRFALLACYASAVWTVGADVLRLWPWVEKHGPLIIPANLARGVVIGAILTPFLATLLYSLFTAPPRRFRLDTKKRKELERVESGAWRASWWSIPDAVSVLSADNGLIVGEAYRADEKPELGGKAPLLRWKPTGHLITVSGAGGGKGVSVAVPQGLTWRNPLVMMDPAAETLPIVRAAREAMGRRICAIGQFKDTAGFNAIGWIDPNGDELIEDVKTVVSWMESTQTKGGENESFREAARNLVSVAILYVLTSPDVPDDERHLGTMRSILSRPDLRDWLAEVVNETSLAHGAVADLAGGILGFADSDKTFGSVLLDVQAYTAFLKSPYKERWLCGKGDVQHKFRVRDLLDGTVDIFICLPVTVLTAEPQVARMILGPLLTAFYRRGSRGLDTLFLLDEMARLGKLDILLTARDFARKYGVIIWAIVQDLGQLEMAYGKEGARGWLETPKVRQFFGINGHETAEMISTMCGDQTVKTESVNQSHGDSTQSGRVGVGRSVNYARTDQATQRRLITASEVLTMATDQAGIPDEQIVLVSGKPPLRCGMAKYFRRRELQNIAGDSAYQPTGTK